MENDTKLIDIRIHINKFENVEYHLISENRGNVCGMIDTSSFSFTLKPQLKDFENMTNLLNFAKSNGQYIELDFKDEYPKIENLYVSNFEPEKETKTFNVEAKA